ncbi:Rv3654c family TadE-like protein [Embleya sp. NPDC005971]|uniref:Rv3654c family TadE-like protein n=1 Tax=unclassified Embleya TaxID=2699296 RepID=UPI0033F7A2AC
MNPRSSAQEGSATLWVVAFALVPLCMAAFVFAFAGAVAARHRAAAAADLAALAAAARAAAGANPEEACALARRVARAQHADPTHCHLTNAFATVEVTTNTPAGPAHATAHAGPTTPRRVSTPDTAETP